MMSEKIPKLNIGDLAIEVPIIQGGMGVGISLANLASAVSNEGGLGVISSIGLGLLYPRAGKTLLDANKIALKKEIRKARMLTNGVLGVNIMSALTDFDDILKVAINEEIDIIFIGAGLPIKIPQNLSLEYLRSVKTKFAPIVSSTRAAKLIFDFWDRKFNHVPDALVLEGPLAGGHLGFKLQQISNPDYSLENILPELVKTISFYENKFDKAIPVIAAGGIYSGSDIYKMFQLGASGVQLGTRFVATHECDASETFKKTFIDCSEEDIGIIESPVGLPGRGIINNFLTDVAVGKRKPFKCPFKCLKTCDYKNAPYCIALALVNAQRGGLEKGFAFCGTNAFKVDRIVSVKELMNELTESFERLDLMNKTRKTSNEHKVLEV